MSLFKPSQCQGCPFERTSKFFVPDEYRQGAKTLLVFQNPGQDEELGRKYLGRDSVGFPLYEPHPPAPLLGPTGHLLESKYLPLAGLTRDDVSLANVIRCRPHGKNDLPLVTHLTYRQAVAHCQHHYFRPPESTTLIVAAGDYALHAMTGEDGTESPGHKISRSVEGWRGWLLPYNPHPLPKMTFTDIYQPRLGQVSVLATFHIAYLWKAPWYEPCVNRDWAMVREILEGRWPEPMPRLLESPPRVWPQESAFDTEFYEKGSQKVIVRYSVAWEEFGEHKVSVVECTHGRLQTVTPPPTSYDGHMLTVWREMLSKGAPVLPLSLPTTSPEMPSLPRSSQPPLGSLPGVFHEGVHRVVSPPTGPTLPPQTHEDPMQTMRSEVLQGGPVWEESGGIRLYTQDVQESDQSSRQSVSHLPQESQTRLGPLPRDREVQGLLVLIVQRGTWILPGQFGLTPSSGCLPLKVVMHHVEADLNFLADLFPPGTLIEIDDSMMAHSVLWNDLDHDLDFVGSMYSRGGRWKHLLNSNPRVYSAGDALGTWDAWHGMQRELTRDPQSKRVYYDFQLPLIPIIARATLTGAKVDTHRVQKALQALSARQTDTIHRAQASVGWPMNLNSPRHILHRLYDVEKIHVNPISGREIRE